MWVRDLLFEVTHVFFSQESFEKFFICQTKLKKGLKSYKHCDLSPVAIFFVMYRSERSFRENVLSSLKNTPGFLDIMWLMSDQNQMRYCLQYNTNLFLSLFRCAKTSISVTSDLSTRSSASLNEEQFEDYGEGEEPDYTPSSPCPDDETRTNGYSDLGSSVPSRYDRNEYKETW